MRILRNVTWAVLGVAWVLVVVAVVVQVARQSGEVSRWPSGGMPAILALIGLTVWVGVGEVVAAIRSATP